MVSLHKPGRTSAGYIRLNPDSDGVTEDGAPGEIYELAKRLRGDTGDAGRALIDLYPDTVGASKAVSGAIDHQADSVIQGINDSLAGHRDEQKRRDLEVHAAGGKRQAEQAEDHARVQEQTDAILEQANCSTASGKLETQKEHSPSGCGGVHDPRCRDRDRLATPPRALRGTPP